MKSNRAVRRLFGAFGKISNTRRIEFRKRSDHWSGWSVTCVEKFKRSRSEQRYFAELKRRRGPHTYIWQHTQGERG